MSEFSFIDWIRRRVRDRPPVLLGIGDDAAMLTPSDRPLLVTTDMLMEGTDFTFPETTPELAGRKSLAVNLSDIAAMGGTPTAAFISVALPKQSPTLARHDVNPPSSREFAERFFTGLLDLAEDFGVVVAGGDTNTWDGPLVANITLLGHPLKSAPITRSGARPGDKIFVTGELGHSIHGHHLTFTPRVREARQLLDLVVIHAMIDISDGLAADLHHILAASGVGAVLDADKIPIRPIDRTTGPLELGSDRALAHALSDGEDFELLFTVSGQDGERLRQTWSGTTRLSCIGEVTSETGCRLSHAGQTTILPALGWVHAL